MHFGEKGHQDLHPHFSMNEIEVEEEEESVKSPQDSINEIIDAQKRELNEWCFAEHYDAPVLLQVDIILVHDHI